MDAIQILEANIKVDEYNSDISWCHGIAGLGLMYLFLEHNFDNGKYHEKIERCAKILKIKYGIQAIVYVMETWGQLIFLFNIVN